jgi:hypothetical protein
MDQVPAAVKPITSWCKLTRKFSSPIQHEHGDARATDERPDPNRHRGTRPARLTLIHGVGLRLQLHHRFGANALRATSMHGRSRPSSAGGGVRGSGTLGPEAAPVRAREFDGGSRGEVWPRSQGRSPTAMEIGDFCIQPIKKDGMDTEATKKLKETSKPSDKNFLTPNPFRP